MNSIEQKNLKLPFGAALASLRLSLDFDSKSLNSTKEATLFLRLLWPSVWVGQTTRAAIQAKYTIGFSASVRRQQLLHKRIQKLELEPGSLV